MSISRSLSMCSFEGVDAGGGAGREAKRTPGRQSGSEAGEGKRSGKAGKASGAEARQGPEQKQSRSRAKARQEPNQKRSRRASTTEDFRWQWLEGSPVPIPNTEVKPPRADGTWLDTARESRSLPESSIRRRRLLRITYSSVAQWQSIRLLTEGL